MKYKYKEDTAVYTIYGGFATYVGPVDGEKHNLKCWLSGDVFQLESNEFDKNRNKAWGSMRAI